MMSDRPKSNKLFHLVDPELRPFLDVFPGFVVTDDTLSSLRALPSPPSLTSPEYGEVFISRIDGDGQLSLIIIDGSSQDVARPALLYMHGGGFVFGSPETILPHMQKLAADTGFVIILPKYRLAPEYPYPAALQDNMLALSWMFENAQSLNVDPKRIAIGGDSAGGGHAVTLAAALRRHERLSASFLFLIYPMLDDCMEKTLNESGDCDTPIWNSDNNRYGWKAYLGDGVSGDNIPSGAVPARLETLKGLPPTFLATGSLDLFADENRVFAKRLSSERVPVEFQIIKGAYHGFNVIAPEAKISKRFHDSCVKALKRSI